MASGMTPLLEHNDRFVRTFTPVPLALPSARVIVVTCLDHRVAPEITLGLKLGDAPVLRNAGGRVTQPVIEEIAYLGFLGRRLFDEQLGPDSGVEVAIIHHTNCGTSLLADPSFRREASEATGVDDETLEAIAVADPHSTVEADVELLLNSPLLPPRIEVSGHVYDVDTGRVTTVVEPRHR